jgi:nucleoside phosphorylase
MRILVTFALETEFAPWRKLREFKRVRINSEHWSGGVEVQQAQVGSSTVWVFLTGMGIKFFDFGAASCLKNAGVNVVLSSGLAGSLKSEFGPGDVVVPRKVGTLRDASGLPMAGGLIHLAEGCGARVIGTLLTADHIIETREEKARLAIFGEAVDMESFHVTSSFIDEHVPAAAIRAISDGSEDNLPVDFNECLTPQGQVKAGPLFKELFGRPAKVPELIRFGRQSRSAAQRLAAFLDGFIQALKPDILNYETTEVAAR